MNQSPLSPKILLENRHLIIIDKPAGMLSILGRLGINDPRPCVLTWFRLERKINVLPIHRLDCEVSGLMILAKRPEVQTIITPWFAKKMINKSYSALTEGTACEDWVAGRTKFFWESRIERGKKRAYEHKDGKIAITEAVWIGHYKVRATDPSGTVSPGLLHWRLSPKTGRSHQLRYELAKQGFPIAGDTLYGAQVREDNKNVALRAVEIDFTACPGAKSLGLPPFIELE